MKIATKGCAVLGWLRFALPASIALNLVMLVVNACNGGWWLAFVPFHVASAGLCAWHWWQLARPRTC